MVRIPAGGLQDGTKDVTRGAGATTLQQRYRTPQSAYVETVVVFLRYVKKLRKGDAFEISYVSDKTAVAVDQPSGLVVKEIEAKEVSDS